MMFTILGADGKEYGPATTGTISAWISGGRANLQTKARRTDETAWRTLGDYPEFGGNPAPVIPDAPAAEPPPPAAPEPLRGTATEMAARLAGQAANFDLFSCLSRSFELWKNNFLPLVGATLLVMVVNFAANLIPLLGFFCSFLLTGVFTGGLYHYYLGRMRGDPREISDVFAGFTRAFVPLMLTGLIQNTVNFLIMGIFSGPVFLSLIQAALQSTPGGHLELPPLSGAAIGWMIVGLIPLCYLGVAWIFAFALVIDQGLNPWTALEVSRRVVSRRWFSMCFLLICAGILGLLGLFGLGVGVLLTLPLTFGALLYAYEDLCRPAT